MKVHPYSIGGDTTGEKAFADYLDADCTATYTQTENWQIRSGGPNVTLTRQAEKAYNWARGIVTQTAPTPAPASTLCVP